jgi:hypothetical protein
MKGNLTEGYFGDEITKYGFISHMKSFIKQLLTDPTKAHIDDYLKKHGLTNEKAVEILIKSPKGDKSKGPVLYRKESIKTGDDGKDVFTIKYQLPREGFKSKMRDLFIDLFESNIVEGCPINEDGCAGALQGGGNNFEAGEFSTALDKPIKRTIFMREDQVAHIKKVLDEATASTSDVTPAGELAWPAFGDKETCDHKNIIKSGIPEGKTLGARKKI